VANPKEMDALLVQLFLESYSTAPQEIVIDADATPAAHESGPTIALRSRPTLCAGRCW
jgi:hypothetical protein